MIDGPADSVPSVDIHTAETDNVVSAISGQSQQSDQLADSSVAPVAADDVNSQRDVNTCAADVITRASAGDEVSSVQCAAAGPSVDCDVSDCFNLQSLADAYVAAHSVHLTDAEQRLNALLRSQRHLVSGLQRENARFVECFYTFNVEELVDQLRVYSARLGHVRRSMSDIHERCAELRRRAQRVARESQARAVSDRRAHQARVASQERLVARIAGSTGQDERATSVASD